MRPLSLVLAVATLCASSSTALAQTTPSGAEDAAEQPLPEPAPPAPVPVGGVDTEVRNYVWVGIAGLATFGASWIATIIVAAATESPDKGLAIGHNVVPVAGPFISLAEGSHAEDIQGVLAGLGALQGAGVAAALLGFTLESRIAVGETEAWVTPMVAPGGLGVTGRF